MVFEESNSSNSTECCFDVVVLIVDQSCRHLHLTATALVVAVEQEFADMTVVVVVVVAAVAVVVVVAVDSASAAAADTVQIATEEVLMTMQKRRTVAQLMETVAWRRMGGQRKHRLVHRSCVSSRLRQRRGCRCVCEYACETRSKRYSMCCRLRGFSVVIRANDVHVLCKEILILRIIK